MPINLKRVKEQKITALSPVGFNIKCNYIFLVPKYIKSFYSCLYVTSKVQFRLTKIQSFPIVVEIISSVEKYT